MGNEKRLVAITGMDGSGKSTLVGRLASDLAGLPGGLRVVGIWDLVKEPDPSEPIEIPFRDWAGADRFLRSLAPPDRAKFIFGCLGLALERGLRSPERTLLLDAYWYKYFASELVMQGEAARPALEALVRDLPTPHFLFFLAIEPEGTVVRKTSFSGYESGYDPRGDAAGFLAFQRRSYACLRDLMKTRSALELDGRAPTETNRARVRESLERA
ncbi:MAG: hypothetical protein JST04_00595 [Bdellovibrionales bacterium]|nr:hypothetical protein [Bdellovibrionales bacterium]